MTKKNSRKGKKNVLQQQKDRLRGLIGEARGFESYKDRKERKRDIFDSKFKQSLIEARESIPSDAQLDYFNWANKMLKDLLPNKTKITKPSWRTISFINESKTINFKAEINWIIARIKKEERTISAFVRIKKDIEMDFINGDFGSIINNLDYLDLNYGHSLWSLETRIGTTQFFKGLEAQKKTYNEIKNLAGIGFIRFTAYRISMRNEPAVSLPRFKQAINALARDYTEFKDLPNFIKYKLSGEAFKNIDSSLSVLRFSQNLSTVDCYEALIETAQNILIYNDDHQETDFLLNKLSGINVSDFRLIRLTDKQTLPLENLEKIDDVENFFNGSAKKSLFKLFRDSKHGCVSAFDMLLIAIVRKNKLSFNNEASIKSLIRRLTTINNKEKDFISTLYGLEKELLNLSTIPFCKALLEGISLLKNIDFFSLGITLKKVALNNSKDDFLNIFIFDSNLKKIQHFIKQGDYPNVKLLANCINKSFEENRFDYYHPNKILELYCRIIFSFNFDNYPACLKYLDDFKKIEGHEEVWNKMTSIETLSLVGTGNIEKAISLIANNVCDKNYPNELIETASVITPKTNWPHIRKYAADISLVIVLDHLCDSTASDSIATLRRTAIDNFLILHKIKKPSDIVNLPIWNNEKSRKKLIYFYEKICIPPVLEMCRCLKSGTSAVERERTDILSILIQLNNENTDHYQDEILSITSDLRIREGLKVVDESRLYVNQEGLLRWSKLEQFEDILRYKNLVDAGIGCAEDISELLITIEKFNDNDKKILKVPENEADELLYKLFCDLQEAFLFENEHGLNSYLSKRIRHNSIAGFLRGAIENENLITLKDSSKKYLENNFWKVKLANIYSEEVVNKSLKELENFGTSFDNSTHYIRDELIQIRSISKPDGRIFIDQEQMLILFHLARSFMQKNNFEISSWVEVASSLFWHMLEPSLSELRLSLISDYKDVFHQHFDILKQNLIKHAGMEISGHEIFSAINNALLELNILLDRASEWLKKGQSELSKSTYSINEIIDIAVRAAVIRHKGCNLSVNKKIDDSINLRADSLVVLSDIILIIIGNISDHSGLREHAELDITACFSTDRSKLAFKFRSRTLSNKNNVEHNAELEKIRQTIKSGDYLSNIANEGKSGLIKIASIVQPQYSGSIDFGFDSSDYFYVNIEIPYTGKSDIPYQKLEVTNEYFAN